MTDEQLVPLSQVPGMVEQMTGDRPSIAAVYRWIRPGICGVRLQTAWAGMLRTSKSRVADFMDAVAEAKANPMIRPATQNAARRAHQKRHEADLEFVLAG